SWVLKEPGITGTNSNILSPAAAFSSGKNWQIHRFPPYRMRRGFMQGGFLIKSWMWKPVICRMSPQTQYAVKSNDGPLKKGFHSMISIAMKDFCEMCRSGSAVQMKSWSIWFLDIWMNQFTMPC